MTAAEQRARTLELARELEAARPRFTHPTVKDQRTGEPLVVAGMSNDGAWVIHPEVAAAGIPDELWDQIVAFVAECRSEVKQDG